eukprot:6492624-Amphidinium_carterae.1
MYKSIKYTPFLAIAIFCVEDVKWALYSKKSQGGVEEAEGTQCENCFSLWKRGFSFMEWPDLVMLGTAEAPKSEAVELQHNHGVRVEKTFIALTEREMRKATGLPRISKTLLRACNQMQVPTPDAKGKETIYLFPCPEEPWRKCIVSSDLHASQRSPILNLQDTLWQGQSEEYHSMAVAELADESYSSFVARDITGHLMTMTWDEFKTSKLLSSEEADDPPEEEDMEDNEETLLLGVAATSAAASSTGKNLGIGLKKGQKKGKWSPQEKGVMKRMGSSGALS